MFESAGDVIGFLSVREIKETTSRRFLWIWKTEKLAGSDYVWSPDVEWPATSACLQRHRSAEVWGNYVWRPPVE
jgi:hypothetical protein